MQKVLIIIGLLFILAGIFLPWIIKSGLGHLPDDITIKRDNVTFYFPIVTCLILSVLISIVFWFFNK